MQNIYIFGSNGQDGTLIKEVLKKKSTQSNLFLFSKEKVIINYPQKPEDIRILNNFEYISIFDSLFKKYPPNLIFYFAAVHFSSTEINKLINKNDLNNMTFANYFLPIHIVNRCKYSENLVKILFASSSLIFSNSDVSPQNEETKRIPNCIYGKQKLLVENFLNKISSTNNLKAYTAILYNHESIYRKPRFFTKKLISFCSEFSQKNKKTKLKLFNKNSKIDLGYAPEYVNAMYKLIQEGRTGSYIFSSQELISVYEAVKEVLSFYNLDNDVVEFNDFQPRNNTQLLGLNRKIKNEINWHPNYTSKKVLHKLCEDYEIYKSLNQ